MSDRLKKIISGLVTAAGAAAGVFAVMEVVRRFQRQGIDSDRNERIGYAGDERHGAQVEVTRYQGSRQPMNQPDRESIPNTGNPAAGVLDAVEPNAGMAAAEIAEYTADILTPGKPLDSDLVGSLVEYLLAFHDLIDRLRNRRASATAPSANSLTLDDWQAMQARLGRLYEYTPDVSEGSLTAGSREERVYNLIVKVRGALQSHEITDDDLFRINGEVRTEACNLLADLAEYGSKVAQARQIFECEK